MDSQTFERPKPAAHNKYLIIAAVLIGLAACLLGAYLYFKKAESFDQAEKEVPSPEEQLAIENQAAIQGAEAQDSRRVRKIDAADYLMGDINAPVQMVVYDDIDSEYGAEYYSVIRKTKEFFGDKLVITIRPYPLRTHQYGFEAAVAAECAGMQGKYYEMLEKLYAAKSEQKLDRENMIASAQALGVDQPKFLACLDDKAILDKIQKLINEAENSSVTGAPTTFIAGIPYPGAYQFEDFTDSTGLQRKGLKNIINEAAGK